jgi:hypothetical protein
MNYVDNQMCGLVAHPPSLSHDAVFFRITYCPDYRRKGVDAKKSWVHMQVSLLQGREVLFGNTRDMAINQLQ